MKKYAYTIIGLILGMILFTLSGYGQTDSTAVNFDAVSNQAETVVLPAIFDLLGAVGVKITPLAGLITGVLMLLLRHFGKKRIKTKFKREIETVKTEKDLQIEGEKENLKAEILTELKNAAQNAGGNLAHASMFKSLIDKIEGPKN